MRIARYGTRRRVAIYLALLGVAAACDIRAGAETEPPTEAPEEEVSPVLAATVIPAGVTAEEVEQGRELFLPCAVCHGFDGAGNQLGPSLRDSTWLHIDGSLPQIEQIIRVGVPQPEEHPVPMVPMGGGDFDGAELRAVASYVYAISRQTSAQTESAAPGPDR